MRIVNAALAAAVTLAIAAAGTPQTAAQDVPDDVRPFVALGADVVVRAFRNPVVQGGRVVDPGELVGEERRRTRLGSGTFLTEEGLILTNEHVYSVGGISRSEDGSRIVEISRLNEQMYVWTLSHNDPLRGPVLRYLARPVCLDRRHDLALLQIEGDMETGGAVSAPGATPVGLADPYGIDIQEELTLVGYPAQGGAHLSITAGNFINYARDAPVAVDGSLITDGAISGGSSGGAALHDGRLVAIPTRVSVDEKGSDYGYLHPISWAVGCLAEAKLRFGLSVPDLPEDWVDSPHNTDDASRRIFAGGRIHSSSAARPVESARVIVHRADWTTREITELVQEAAGLRTVLEIHALARQGHSAEQIARQHYQLGVDRIRQVLERPLDETSVPPELKRMMEGEFFFAAATTRRDGWYKLTLPRDRELKMVVLMEGYRPYSETIRTGGGLFQDLGERGLFRR